MMILQLSNVSSSELSTRNSVLIFNSKSDFAPKRGS